MSTSASDKFSRLPEVAKPSLYTINLKPNLETFKCEGHEVITLDITKPTDFLKLHSSEIEIKSAGVELADGSVLKDLPVEIDRKWMTLNVKLPKTLDPQQVKLIIDFVAEHNNKMHGFYRSSYKGADGKEKFLVSTQFESTYARLSFPCWDEPVYKAQFDITLEVDPKLTALSNMNVVSEELNDGRKVVKFGTTPIMSSYLVAFAVGEFEYIETKTKAGIPVRVYTVEGKKHLGEYSLGLAAKALDYYNEWFDIPYPLPKCDLIAIPDFSMGAMENWGLVTYREVALLVDPAKSSTRQSMYVALVVAHELAHFWFGDLATMKWWDNLWLKEGFASFMEYLFVSKHCPEFDIWVHFVQDEWSRGMSLDCLRSSHPIEVPIDNPNELDEIYDSITYAKSNSVIRMLFNYLTEPVFQKGLQIYLKKFQYSNAETQDLWDAFSEASGQDIGKMMSTWTRQMGFPMVTAEQKVEGNKRILKLTQTRFLADGGKDEANSLWRVPFTISSASSPNEAVFRGLLTEPEQEFTVENVGPEDWLKVNSGTAGFFRVHYSDDMLNALLPAVEKKSLPVLDRFGMANDLYALVESGKASASQFLSFVAASSNETEYIVWSALDGGISHLNNTLQRHDDPSIKSRLDQFVIKIYEPVFNRLGWEAIPNEPLKDSLLRALVISRLSRANHQPVIDTAREKFRDHIEKKTELHPDLRSCIYGIVARNDGNEGVEKLRNIFETVGFSEVERNCIVAMGQATEEPLLKSIYDYGVIQGKIRAQDLVSLFAGSSFTKVGQDYTWNFFQQNYKILLEKFGSANSNLFQHCLKCVSDSQCDDRFAETFEKFCKESFDEDSLKVLDRPIRQASEAIHLNSKLLKHSAPSVNEFLIKSALIFITTGLVHTSYLLALWYPTDVIYNARWLFFTGFIPGLAISAMQIAIFYLGLERIYCIFLPMKSSVNRKIVFLCGCIGSQVLLIVVGFVVVFPDFPRTSRTQCRAVNCLMRQENSRIYMLYRAIFSFVNTVIGIIIYISVKRKLGGGDSTKRRGLTTRLAISTFFCEFAFDLMPHSTIIIIGLTGKSYLKNPGPYSLFFGSLDVGLCAVLYKYSFVKLRRALDKKAVVGTRLDAISAPRPTINALNDLRF